jgi:hypothetical protein
MFDLLALLRARLAEEPSGVDYNHLSLSERQAALALVEADEARFQNIKGRTRVVRKASNWPLRFLSMGERS